MVRLGMTQSDSNPERLSEDVLWPRRKAAVPKKFGDSWDVYENKGDDLETRGMYMKTKDPARETPAMSMKNNVVKSKSSFLGKSSGFCPFFRACLRG